MAKSLRDGVARAVGVTRVGRVTGLDRTGVEVAVAVRPGGHVLQVCNGKGEDWEQAALGAVLEAAELAWAERIDPSALTYGSRHELSKRFSPERVWPASDLGSAGALTHPALWNEDVVCAWRIGFDLVSGAEVFVPAQAVHCPPPDSASLGPISVAWTTNGSGAHPDPDAALVHALLEATERDQLARALPEGWTEEAVIYRRLRPESLRHGAPNAWRWVQVIAARGFDVALFDLTPDAENEGALGLPVAGALLVDREGGPIPVTAGYACRLDRDSALVAALLEAAQSRITDIHGARDDVHHADPAQAEALIELLGSSEIIRDLKWMPRPPKPKDPSGALRQVLAAFERGGVERAAAVFISPDPAPVHALKVVVPGFKVSELLL